MDRELIREKLESLRRCVQRIAEKCPGDVLVLINDVDLQDILALNLSRAVQLCVDIGAHLIADLNTPPPDTMGKVFDVLHEQRVITADLAIRLKKSVGFRNIAVHNYEAINWSIVHAIARHHRQDFVDFAKAIDVCLERPS